MGPLELLSMDYLSILDLMIMMPIFGKHAKLIVVTLIREEGQIITIMEIHMDKIVFIVNKIIQKIIQVWLDMGSMESRFMEDILIQPKIKLL